MPKQAISVTLEVDNLVWLKGRAGAAGARSVSELLDRIVTAARKSGGPDLPRSVVGTITLDPSDPRLEKADAAVRALFHASLGRPLAVNEQRATYPAAKRPRRRRG